MAFYDYKGDFDERYWTAYDCDFGGASQYSSPYDLGEPNLVDYSSSAYYKDNYSHPINYYDYSVNPSQTIYSQPKFLEHHQVYFPSETKFTISYSNVEFNEPEFKEYDPTPYDGGYDQTMTYGKPLPPSDLTCYPRSLPQSDAPPLDNFSYDSTPSPYGKDDPNGSKPADTKIETETHVGNGGKDAEIVQPRGVIPTGSYPSYEHQNGYQIPYGSGLEAMDICESIFGYWPCLAKNAQQQQQQQQQRNHCHVCHQDSRMDPWKSAADYFFGSPVPYDYDNYHHRHSLYQSNQ